MESDKLVPDPSDSTISQGADKRKMLMLRETINLILSELSVNLLYQYEMKGDSLNFILCGFTSI
jgi:hypothetical protein